MTKETLDLVDALLERVRAEVLSNVALGAEVSGKIDISGDTDIDEKITEHLQPAIEAVLFALKIAQFAPGGIIDRFFWECSLYFADENGEVRMGTFSDVERVWRPLPPGPACKIEWAPPEDVEIPDPVGGGDGPIQ